MRKSYNYSNILRKIIKKNYKPLWSWYKDFSLNKTVLWLTLIHHFYSCIQPYKSLKSSKIYERITPYLRIKKECSPKFKKIMRRLYNIQGHEKKCKVPLPNKSQKIKVLHLLYCLPVVLYTVFFHVFRSFGLYTSLSSIQ